MAFHINRASKPYEQKNLCVERMDIGGKNWSGEKGSKLRKGTRCPFGDVRRAGGIRKRLT